MVRGDGETENGGKEGRKRDVWSRLGRTIAGRRQLVVGGVGPG